MVLEMWKENYKKVKIYFLNIQVYLFYNKKNICIAVAGNLSKKTFEEYYENNFSYLDLEKTSQIKNNNEFIAVSSIGREEINFKNIEFLTLD